MVYNGFNVFDCDSSFGFWWRVGRSRYERVMEVFRGVLRSYSESVTAGLSINHALRVNVRGLCRVACDNRLFNAVLVSIRSNELSVMRVLCSHGNVNMVVFMNALLDYRVAEFHLFELFSCIHDVRVAGFVKRYVDDSWDSWSPDYVNMFGYHGLFYYDDLNFYFKKILSDCLNDVSIMQLVLLLKHSDDCMFNYGILEEVFHNAQWSGIETGWSFDSLSRLDSLLDSGDFINDDVIRAACNHSLVHEGPCSIFELMVIVNNMIMGFIEYNDVSVNSMLSHYDSVYDVFSAFASAAGGLPCRGYPCEFLNELLLCELNV